MGQRYRRNLTARHVMQHPAVLRRGVTWLALFFLLTPLWAQDHTALHPLTREEAITLALQHHPSLQEAMSRTAAARAGTERVNAAQHIQVKVDSRFVTVSEVPTLTPAGGIPTTLGEKNTWLTALAAEKVVYSGGRLEALSRQASSAAQAATVRLERTRQYVAFGAERAFLLLIAAQREREVAQQALQTAEAHLAIARVRYTARATAQFDVLHAEVEVEEARQEVIRAESDRLIAHAALLQAMGVTNGDFLAGEAPVLVFATQPTLESFLQQALEGRPELRAFDWQLEAAAHAITAARAERRPTVSLLAEYQFVSPESPLQLTRWSAGIAMSLPLLDGGAARARQREATAQRDETLAAREALRQIILTEVSQAYARLRSALAQTTVAGKRVEQSEEMLRIATVRYQEGIGTAMEIADAHTTVTRARQGLVQAQTQAAIAEGELRLATGATNWSIQTRQQEALP